MSMQDNPLYDQLSSLLQKAGTLVTKDIPEARKNIPVGELEVPIRIANIITNMGIFNIWDLVHMNETELGRWNYFNSRPRTSELIDAIDQSIKILTGEMQLPEHVLEEQA